MADLVAAAQAFRILSERLREAGETGLRRELGQAIADAARPLVEEIGSTGHLMDYMPNRYAEVLAEDLSVQIRQQTGVNTGVTLRARGRVRNRHVTRRERGILTHPVFAQGERSTWHWAYQDIRPGFFSDPAERSAPQIRQAVLEAMSRVADQVTRGA